MNGSCQLAFFLLILYCHTASSSVDVQRLSQTLFLSLIILVIKIFHQIFINSIIKYHLMKVIYHLFFFVNIKGCNKIILFGFKIVYVIH